MVVIGPPALPLRDRSCRRSLTRRGTSRSYRATKAESQPPATAVAKLDRSPRDGITSRFAHERICRRAKVAASTLLEQGALPAYIALEHPTAVSVELGTVAECPRIAAGRRGDLVDEPVSQSRRSAQPNGQRLKPSKRQSWAPVGLAGRFEVGESLEKPVEQFYAFGTRESCAEAKVNAGTERERWRSLASDV